MVIHELKHPTLALDLLLDDAKDFVNNIQINLKVEELI